MAASRWRISVATATLVCGITAQGHTMAPEPVELAAAATPAVSVQVPVPPPPESIWWLLWPLSAAPHRDSQARAEVADWAAALAQGKASAACGAAVVSWEQRMREAAALFYAPVRKNPDLDSISAFLARWVRGPSPLLVVVGEGFAWAPAARDVAATACARAWRWAEAERMLRPTALERRNAAARVAVTLLRWRALGDLRASTWWLEGQSNATARLLVALAKPESAWRAAAAAVCSDPAEEVRRACEEAVRWRESIAQSGQP